MQMNFVAAFCLLGTVILCRGQTTTSNLTTSDQTTQNTSVQTTQNTSDQTTQNTSVQTTQPTSALLLALLAE
ncbi:unnamed protein product [Menidia menidia]|uniref:(Atlantic silverside) hypothetical protein n=1 Tax=Menidia menidia TaxID=238744 RepID=A0A8S4AH72_9TELE|nr:unnamed protein product [Menidia menidia]